MKIKLINILIFTSLIFIGCTNTKSELNLKNIKNEKIIMKNYANTSLFQDKEFKNVFGAGKSLYATEKNYVSLIKRQNTIQKRYKQLCKNERGHIELLQKKNNTLNKIILDIHNAKMKKYTDIVSTKLVPNNYHKNILNEKNNSIYIRGTNFPKINDINQYTCRSGSKRIFDYYITPIYYDLIKTLFKNKNSSGKITNDKERALWLGLNQEIYIY